MDPILHILSYIPAFGLRDYLALFALVLTVFAIILARAPRPAPQTADGPLPGTTTADSVAVLERIIQHLREERWADVVGDCAVARAMLAALWDLDAASVGVERSRLGTAIEHLARLEALAVAQSRPGAHPADAATWVRVTLDLQEIRAILRARESP